MATRVTRLALRSAREIASESPARSVRYRDRNQQYEAVLFGKQANQHGPRPSEQGHLGGKSEFQARLKSDHSRRTISAQTNSQ